MIQLLLGLGSMHAYYLQHEQAYMLTTAVALHLQCVQLRIADDWLV